MKITHYHYIQFLDTMTLFNTCYTENKVWIYIQPYSDFSEISGRVKVNPPIDVSRIVEEIVDSDIQLAHSILQTYRV